MERSNYYNSIRWNQPYTMSVGWRKRKIIENTLNELHSQQLDMIDAAVDESDLSQAKEVIKRIQSKA